MRGVRLESLPFSPAGLLTTGALLWFCAESLARGTKLGVTAASLWFFPDTTHEVVLVGALVSLGVVALLAARLSSECRARAIGVELRERPWRLAGTCSLIAIVTIVANVLGMGVLVRLASVETVQYASLPLDSILPLGGYLSWIVVPVLLFVASRRAVRVAVSGES